MAEAISPDRKSRPTAITITCEQHADLRVIATRRLSSASQTILELIQGAIDCASDRSRHHLSARVGWEGGSVADSNAPRLTRVQYSLASAIASAIVKRLRADADLTPPASTSRNDPPDSDRRDAA